MASPVLHLHHAHGSPYSCASAPRRISISAGQCWWSEACVVFDMAHDSVVDPVGWPSEYFLTCYITKTNAYLQVLAKLLPWPIGLVSSLFTNNSKKWRDMGKQLELPATLFFWWLAIEVSFLPTMVNHNVNGGDKSVQHWQKTMNKVLVTFFVGFVLNFVEKIIIQLIAISFHLRTYQDRIELNKFQIGSLAKLYKFSKEKITMEDSEFEQEGGPSGARTPGQFVMEAQKNLKQGFNKFGDIAGKVAGDFTGRQVTSYRHPNQVVLTLIATTSGAQVLARRLYRTFARPETETVHSDDLKNAFDSNEEADAAFSMFDKDMNGDISMEELEAVCVEIGRERRSITASLKDLDSVVAKLDDVFMFIVLIITIIIFISSRPRLPVCLLPLVPHFWPCRGCFPRPHKSFFSHASSFSSSTLTTLATVLQYTVTRVSLVRVTITSLKRSLYFTRNSRRWKVTSYKHQTAT
jgi:hypothetical protein